MIAPQADITDRLSLYKQGTYQYLLCHKIRILKRAAAVLTLGPLSAPRPHVGSRPVQTAQFRDTVPVLSSAANPLFTAHLDALRYQLSCSIRRQLPPCLLFQQVHSAPCRQWRRSLSIVSLPALRPGAALPRRIPPGCQADAEAPSQVDCRLHATGSSTLTSTCCCYRFCSALLLGTMPVVPPACRPTMSMCLCFLSTRCRSRASVMV